MTCIVSQIYYNLLFVNTYFTTFSFFLLRSGRIPLVDQRNSLFAQALIKKHSEPVLGGWESLNDKCIFFLDLILTNKGAGWQTYETKRPENLAELFTDKYFKKPLILILGRGL